MPDPKHPKDPQEEHEPQRREDSNHDEEADADDVSKVARQAHDPEDLAEELAPDDLEDLAEDDSYRGEGPDA